MKNTFESSLAFFIHSCLPKASNGGPFSKFSKHLAVEIGSELQHLEQLGIMTCRDGTSILIRGNALMGKSC